MMLILYIMDIIQIQISDIHNHQYIKYSLHFIFKYSHHIDTNMPEIICLLNLIIKIQSNVQNQYTYYLINIMKSLIKYMKPYLSTKKSHPTQSKTQQCERQYILITYRSKIQKVLPTTYYNADSGWGCMLRVGQMFVANLYYLLQGHNKSDLIRLFYDNKTVPFSIQLFTDTATKLYQTKKPYQWYSPCQCGFIIKQLLEMFDNCYRVSICNDNCLFLDDIQTDREKLIILMMCRIGLDQPQPEYLKCVLALFKLKHFNSILGGTPKRAHLFLKNIDGYLGFLDPHTTQKVPPYQELKQHEQQYISKLLWIKQKQIDSSMAIAFVVPRVELEQFWIQMEKTKQQLGENFFIYMQKQRPVFDDDQNGIIEITDEDFE